MAYLHLISSNLFIHELLHLLVALAISFYIYKKFKSFRLAAVAFLASFLIDLDHYFEGILINGLNHDWQFLIRPGAYWSEVGTMTLFFHGLEFIPLTLLMGKIFKKWPLAVSLALAMFGHYLVDVISYALIGRMPLWFYFFSYRLYYQFDYHFLCRP